jgi:magnesium-transporting ATPase (P-type)
MSKTAQIPHPCSKILYSPNISASQTLRQPLFRDTPIFADSLLTETRDRKNRRVFIVEPSVTKPVSKPDSKDDLKSLPMPEVEKRLGSSAKGLSQAEAQKRLAQYGPNEIKEKKDNLFLKFLSYFWGPIPWMIEGAVILSGVVKHWLDFFIILFLLFSNAVVAFWEEHQAGNEIAALRAKLATEARVLRTCLRGTPGRSRLLFRCDQGEPPHLPADEQLRDLPHRRNAARAVFHDAGNPRI